ncbi:hypothetical protein ACHAPT_012702 [Fusarium lateritium]
MADTRYKLYINSRMIYDGPVKGDGHAWFYGVLDIQPYLRVGRNTIAVHVFRFYYASKRASSFARNVNIQTDETWETAIDPCIHLLAKANFDNYLNIFEQVDERESHKMRWVTARSQGFKVNYGHSMPFNLCPRMIPLPRREASWPKAIHKVKSSQPPEEWSLLLDQTGENTPGILLPRGTTHHVEFEMEHYTTAHVRFCFARPSTSGSILDVTWCERYSDEPTQRPFPTYRGDRADTTGFILGPKDQYIFAGSQDDELRLWHDESEGHQGIFAPFHCRAFRFFALDIRVTQDSDLVLKQIDIVKTNYPLKDLVEFPQVDNDVNDSTWFHKLWEVSIRTLQNYMHDCYEDCPFYEQLQYSMDSRSSSLFTYLVSRDDRLARQAIIQLFNSFQPALGLMPSRAPCYLSSIISHFCLFWICMVTDHYEYLTFHNNLDEDTGLVRTGVVSCDWPFVDWTYEYRPFGVPPAAQATGFSTFTSQLYAYTLQRLGRLELCLGRQYRAEEHNLLTKAIAQAVRTHCFDGMLFTDGLASMAESNHYSQHSQIWAVLCGAITGKEAAQLLRRSLAHGSEHDPPLSKVSTAMAFYSMQALSAVSDGMYEDQFHDFWEPWRKQLDLNLTTWVEDHVQQRSDCHGWGSLPLYEFVAEVAGLRPLMKDGRRVLESKPRVHLFRTFQAKIPAWGSVDDPLIAHVEWHKAESGLTTVSLSWEGTEEIQREGHQVPVDIVLPDGQEEKMNMLKSKVWSISE